MKSEKCWDKAYEQAGWQLPEEDVWSWDVEHLNSC